MEAIFSTKDSNLRILLESISIADVNFTLMSEKTPSDQRVLNTLNKSSLSLGLAGLFAAASLVSPDILVV